MDPSKLPSIPYYRQRLRSRLIGDHQALRTALVGVTTALPEIVHIRICKASSILETLIKDLGPSERELLGYVDDLIQLLQEHPGWLDLRDSAAEEVRNSYLRIHGSLHYIQAVLGQKIAEKTVGDFWSR